MYTFEELVHIIGELRGEHGCAWDKAQTHGSLKDCMINEAKEVVEGIEIFEGTGDGDNLCEELGDVLLQVLLHSKIAEEEGIFTLDDVIDGIAKKMIRRHPHVFGENKGGPPPDWEEIKKIEKEMRYAEKRQTLKNLDKQG